MSSSSSSVNLKMEVAKPSSDFVSESKQLQQEEEEEEEEEEEQQQKHFHVLAVDDSLLDRKLLERLLRGSSYQVTCVNSGDEALKYLGLVDDLNQNFTASSPPTSPRSPELEGSSKVINLIMTDYCMPGMTGYDLLKRVKGSSWKNVPVVVMSSENVPSRISMCLEEGAEEFFLKPLQVSDLKKLQPYLLKSLHNNKNNNVDGGNEVAGGDDNSDQIDQTKNAADKDSKGNSNISIISKRMAVIAQAIPERRPKMEGLAVLV